MIVSPLGNGLTPEGPGAAFPPTYVPDDGAKRQESVAARLGRAATWNSMAQFIPIPINLVLTPFVIHGLGIERWGLFVLLLTITTLLTSFDGGIGATALRYFGVYAGRDDRVSTTRLLLTLSLLIVVAGVAVSIVDWFVSPVLARSLDMPATLRPEATFFLRTIGLLVTFSFLHGLFNGVVQARYRFALTTKVAFACYALWVVGLVLSVDLRFGLRGVAVVFIVQQALATVLTVPFAIGYLTTTGLGLLRWSELRGVLRFSGAAQLSAIAQLVNIEVDGLLIGIYLSVRTLAFYNTGSNIAMQLRTVAENMLAPAETHLTTVYGARGYDAALEEYRRLQTWWVTAIAGWCAVGMGAVYFGVRAWLGPEFGVAGEIGVILLAGHMFSLFTRMSDTFLTSIGHPEVSARAGTASVVLNVALTLALLTFGTLGIVSATAASQVLISFWFVRLTRRRISPALPGFAHQIPVVACLVAGAVTVGLEFAIAPLVFGGAGGLVVCGVPAVPGLAVFALIHLGPGRCRHLLGAMRRRGVRGAAGMVLSGAA